jgi:hypothetical protein
VGIAETEVSVYTTIYEFIAVRSYAAQVSVSFCRDKLVILSVLMYFEFKESRRFSRVRKFSIRMYMHV